MLPRIFQALLRRRRAAWLLLALLTAGALLLIATRLRADFAVEYFFPQHDPSKIDYDRYKQDFPYEDCRALVIVVAPDVFSREGLARLRRLEDDLARIPGVIDTDSLVTARDPVAGTSEDGEATITMEPLFPRDDLPDPEIARRREIATTDPLFRWFLTPPDGRSTTVRVTLDPRVAWNDEGRTGFLRAAREVLQRHAHPGQRLVLNGLPVIRAEYTEMIGRDMGTLVPLALLVTVVILAFSFRAWAPVAAGVLTLVLAAIWTLGASAALGYPVQLLTQLTPIVCMIVSISDTVHIVSHFRAACDRGLGRATSVVEALTDSAGPCLLTEVVIALGFLGLIGQDMRMISEFGVVTAVGMMLTWLANVSVLPLALHAWTPETPAHARPAGPAHRVLGGTTRRIAAAGEKRPALVVAAAVAITATALAASLGIGMEYYAYDDLKPTSALYKNMRQVEEVHGGTVPLAVFVEPPVRRALLVGADDALESVVREALERSPLRFSLLSATDHPHEVPPEAFPHLLLLSIDAVRREGAEWLKAVAGSAARAGRTLAVVGRGRSAPPFSPADREAYLAAGATDVINLSEPGEPDRVARLLRRGEPMLEPDAVRLLDRISRFLEEKFPEVRRAGSAADSWRKIHRLWTGEVEARAKPLPETRAQAAQELLLLDSWEVSDYLADDRGTAAVFAMVPDVGSTRATAIKAELDAYLAREEDATGYRVTSTGIFAIADGIYRNLVGGLARSLGFALLVSLVAFTLVLRSWRLGLIALVPNVLPLLLTMGVMAAFGIDLKPTTVICFTITLVIADDDTIQFLVRYRRRYIDLLDRGTVGHHGRVATEILHDTGASMLLTAFSVSAGFLVLVFSEFVGLRNLGVLIGISLFTAVFADLYLSPVMLRAFRPRIEGRRTEGGIS